METQSSPRYTQLIPLAEALWRQFGATPPVEGLRVSRAEVASGIMRVCYQPSLCVVLRGAKVSSLGSYSVNYSAGQCLLASVHVPVTARITEASYAAPYLAFSLAMPPTLIGELMTERQSGPEKARSENQSTQPAIQAAYLLDSLIDPLQRLMRLPETPGDLPVLRPLIMKEIAWRLLNSELSAYFYDPGWQESTMARIGSITAWLQMNYQHPIRVGELAARVNMSEASFYRHFKAVTQLSPIQFQKQIRLQEARGKLLTEQDIAAIGYAVGYESASQFSRDYRQLFGCSPKQDRQALLSAC